jgi:hypothetical protein
VQGVCQRAVLTGIGAGAAAGAVVGTLALPVVATMVGAMFGAGVGALLGLANVPALCLLAGRERRPGPARIRAAVVSGVASVALMALLARDLAAAFLPVAAVFAAVSSLIGAAVGPYAAYGRPVRRGALQPGHLLADTDGVAPAFGRGAVAGSLLGAVTGLIAGGAVDPATAWAAALVLAGLAALVGGALGAALALLAARGLVDRVLGAAVLAGAVLGGVAGTSRLPLYGTAAGALVGAVLAAALVATGDLLVSCVIRSGRHARRP